MKPEVVAVRCLVCESTTIHIVCDGANCKHDAGLEMLKHVGLEHPQLVYTASEFMDRMERHRLTQFARLSRN